jgi:hypothetical protein
MLEFKEAFNKPVKHDIGIVVDNATVLKKMLIVLTRMANLRV